VPQDKVDCLERQGQLVILEVQELVLPRVSLDLLVNQD
jgi:hypothetical protein